MRTNHAPLATAIAIVASGAACGGTPHHLRSAPAPLPRVAQPAPPEVVELELPRLKWSEMIGGGFWYRVKLSSHDLPPGTSTRPLGWIRTDHVEVSEGDLLRCGWQALSAGESPRCADPDDARERTRPLVEGALAALRAKGAEAGAHVVRQVRCYVLQPGLGRPGAPHLFCEGVAAVTTSPVAGMPASAHARVEARLDPEPMRWTLAATATGGAYGDAAVLGSTLEIGYRPIMLAFHIESVLPAQAQMALGFDLFYRHRFSDRLDAIAGGQAFVFLHANTDNSNADEARFIYGAFAGVRWRPGLELFDGLGVVFLDLRAGVLSGPAHTIDHMTQPDDSPIPTLQLCVGLMTPDR